MALEVEQSVLTLSNGHHSLDAFSISSHLSLEGLVFLVFALDVGWIQVRLVSSHLDLLCDPGLYLIGITAELLKGVRLTEFGSFVNQGCLQGIPPNNEGFYLVFFKVLLGYYQANTIKYILYIPLCVKELAHQITLFLGMG